MRQQEKQRILVVDDERSIADTLTIILRHAGYDATAYYDPASALEACSEGAPDLLISDVIMPGITGIDLAILVQRRWPQCRIMLISGLGISFDLMDEARRHGHAFEIFEKPIHPSLLLEEVAEALREPTLLQFPDAGARSPEGDPGRGERV